MSQDPKFLQRWEFRRRDDDFDSSSDDSRSSSSSEPVYKKHKLVSNLILPQNDENSKFPGSQMKGQFESNSGGHLKFGEDNKMHIGLGKKNNAVTKKSYFRDRNKKKNKSITQKPISLDGFKIFMESTLEELKVARENMFSCMREEMKKLVGVENASRPMRKEGSCVQKVSKAQHQKGAEICMKTQNCNGGSLKRSLSNQMVHFNNCYEVHGKRVNHEQVNEAITSNGKDEGERLTFPIRKPTCLSNTPDQVVSSPYLTLPTVLSKPKIENNWLDSSSFNYIQQGVTGNNTSVNLERSSSMIDSSSRHGYFLGIQQGEQFGSSAELGSKNMGYFGQHRTQTSSIGTGFPALLHHDSNNSFNISTQVVLENTSSDASILGLRINGGAIRFSGGSYSTLSENFIANNFRSHTNHKTGI